MTEFNLKPSLNMLFFLLLGGLYNMPQFNYNTLDRIHTKLDDQKSFNVSNKKLWLIEVNKKP